MTDGHDEAFGHATKNLRYPGLTKREYFAAMAMSGLTANPEYRDTPIDVLALDALRYGDALIKELNVPRCALCNQPITDGHYDEENDICANYERARSEAA